MVGRDPKIGAVVTQYEPPAGLSPAMLRYVWKQRFDDRGFWAAILGLAAKCAIRISFQEGIVSIQAAEQSDGNRISLAREERRLLKDLVGSKHKNIKLSMLSDSATAAIANLSESLRSQALGRWFEENSRFVLTGAALSLIPIVLAARPVYVDEWVALAIELAIMGPAAFYGMLLALRFRDVIRATRGNPFRFSSRTLPLLAILISCVTAIVFGFGMLAATFGMLTFNIAIVMVVLAITFAHLLRAPTVEGTKILVQIEGFRDFLRSVEKQPLDRTDAPGETITRYEKYLPYAVALEVEQAWSDQLVALGSTAKETWSNLHATCYYLGIWRGKPVDLVVGPNPRG